MGSDLYMLEKNLGYVPLTDKERKAMNLEDPERYLQYQVHGLLLQLIKFGVTPDQAKRFMSELVSTNTAGVE